MKRSLPENHRLYRNKPTAICLSRRRRECLSLVQVLIDYNDPHFMMADPHGLQAMASSVEEHGESDSETSSSSSSESSSSSSSSGSETSTSDSSSTSGHHSDSDQDKDATSNTINIDLPPEVDLDLGQSSSLLKTINDVAESDANFDDDLSSPNEEITKKTSPKKVKKSVPDSQEKSTINVSVTNGLNKKSKPKAKKKSELNDNELSTKSLKKKLKVETKKEGKSPSTQQDDCRLQIEDLSPKELEVIKAIGRIKRQKQRPSFERIYAVLKVLKESFQDFDSNDKVKDLLDSCIQRKLLQEVDSDKQEVTYREKGPGLAIVAHYARRKNAIQLAQKFNVDLTKFAVDDLSPLKISKKTKKKTISPKEGKKKKDVKPSSSRPKKTKTSSSTSLLNNKNKKQVKKKKVVKKDILQLFPSACQESPSIQVTYTGIPILLPGSVPATLTVTSLPSFTLPMPSFQPQQQLQSQTKICGLCQVDSSHDSLITCSVCGLSGEYIVMSALRGCLRETLEKNVV